MSPAPAPRGYQVMSLPSPLGQAPLHDRIAEEVPVALVYNGVSHAVMMATPLDLLDFALGFSLTEGIIEQASELYDVEQLDFAQGIELQLEISAARMDALKRQRRNLTGRTGCGLCGTAALEQAIRPIQTVHPRPCPTPAAIEQAVQSLKHHQPLQNLTGALHAAAWCDTNGEICWVREDVGRHNALDKLIGVLQKQGVLLDGFLLVSSRASYELVQKACRINAPTLVAVSAPTSLAVEQARAAGLNLIGFARPGQYVLYHQSEALPS